jgi:nitroreductase
MSTETMTRPGKPTAAGDGTMREKPKSLPVNQLDGSPLKPITQVLLDRRATSHFTSEPVPDEYLNAILSYALQAPSGYNFQPWRFIVARDLESRRRLRRAAYDQEKITEAPVVVIAVGMKEEPKQQAGEILREGAERGAGKVENVERVKKSALDFLSTMRMDVWVNRQTMIAFTAMMLAAEAYGFDTAPMEGFDPAAVKREFGIPEEGEVVALLAIGRARLPDKAYPGRFGVEDVVFLDHYGQPWREPVK